MLRPFEFGAEVIGDGDESIPMVVVGFAYAKDSPVDVKCGYWNNGESKEAWFAAWRLKVKGSQ